MAQNFSKVFNSEAEFEQAFITLLTECGWEKEIIKYPTEEQLIENWKNILYNNNRSVDRLGDYPLTDGEMNQIIEQINKLRTPFALNSFINGKTVSIKRENPDDKLHFGKEVSLHIYDRQEIAGGKSHYQIVEQPTFKAKNSIFPQRRGDIMLLINGMPVFHIELKQSGHPLSEAWNQIEKYSSEGIFSGLFSLVQIFVAMTPDDAVYFTNPGPEVKRFNKNFFFHWEDFDNVPIHNWNEFTKRFLYIPMAHQLIGFFTVPDKKDGVLKVLRSYQYYAVSAIMSVVSKNTWDRNEQKGGFVWHTTGSGKTLTSFKAADLISKTKDTDKVVFLVDRKELDSQSLDNYKNFADSKNDVQGVESTDVLITKLKSSASEDSLIVASIQKMSRIYEDGTTRISKDIEIINRKRIVFIVDECHRDTFGEMMASVKETFPNALFFGFTGTPILEENAKKGCNSSDVFGRELHRYTIGDGIRDNNVLGFDLYMVETYKAIEVKKAIALSLVKANSEAEALLDAEKKAQYYDVIDNMEMLGHLAINGKYVKGVEDYLTKEQYGITTEHPQTVVKDILSRFNTVSRGREFHAIFATSSIPEALNYYNLFKGYNSGLNISVLVDPSEDNSDGNITKIEGLAKIIEDYNEMYDTRFTISTYAEMKKDIQLRLSHEKTYIGVSKDKDKQLDLLIVVNQMLTGFDSKWINALYLDKIMVQENIIQAISRTNRIFGPDKPFGIIYYYRKPYTMKNNIEKAIELYSGNKAFMVCVNKLPENLKEFNKTFKEIKEIFVSDAIEDFSRIPRTAESQAKFIKEFNTLIRILEKIRIQGFTWKKTSYLDDSTGETIEVDLSEETFAALLVRYNEFLYPINDSVRTSKIPFDIDTSITEISTGKIDINYMNSNFKRYIKLKFSDNDKKLIDDALTSVYSSFKFLSEEEQKYANILIKDIENGDLIPEEEKTFRDYITEYMHNAKNDQINRFAETFGLNEQLLRELVNLSLTAESINEFGRFDKLIDTLDIIKTISYFTRVEGETLTPFKARSKLKLLTHDFIIKGKFDLQ